MTDKQILTVCPPEFPGTTAVLNHFKTTGLTEHGDTVSPDTVNDKALVMLGAWHPIYYEALARIRSSNVTSGIFWTSSVGQTDFSNGGVEVSYLHVIADWLRSGILDYLFVATPSVKDMCDQFVDPEKVILLPYAYDWEDIQKNLKLDVHVGDDWVDLFCPADTRKNVLVQTHGSKIGGAHLHYSGISPKYKWFAELLDVKHTDMGWMDKPDPYYTVVQSMKLGLQVTYAETFDYVVAEHFGLKRPCLISTVMGQWVDKKLWKDLMVYNLDDPLEIGDCIANILSMDNKEWTKLGNACHKFMKKEAKKRNKTAAKVLKGVIEK
jgi:hypothetical protein